MLPAMEEDIEDPEYVAVLDRCQLHMRAAINRGFSPEAAEEMAVALHAVLLAASLND